MRPRHRVNQLMVEADLHLSGYFAEYLDTQNRSVPSWAWLSVLAHSSSEKPRSPAMDDDFGDRRLTGRSLWRQAIAFLAGESLAHHDDDMGLEKQRRSVLLPLELAWLRIGQRSAHPHQLVRTVLTALTSIRAAGSDESTHGKRRLRCS
jgi:hypothetical protein